MRRWIVCAGSFSVLLLCIMKAFRAFFNLGRFYFFKFLYGFYLRTGKNGPSLVCIHPLLLLLQHFQHLLLGNEIDKFLGLII